jgi:hypothetical protein
VAQSFRCEDYECSGNFEKKMVFMGANNTVSEVLWGHSPMDFSAQDSQNVPH